MAVQHVLTVCVGNICRSPAAQYLLRHSLPGLRVSSAGLGALVGRPISGNMHQLLVARGIDASAHRAQPLAEWMVRQASLVLVAEQSHRQRIERLYPFARGKVFRLCEAQPQDVPDPYRKTQADYQHSLDLIEQGLGPWVDKIRALGHLTPQP